MGLTPQGATLVAREPTGILDPRTGKPVGADDPYFAGLNDELADTLGIDVFRYKLVSFVAGNVGAAVAGSLYSFYISYIDPNYFSLDQSLAIIAMALLGGREFVAAPIVGALVLTALPHVINVNAEARLLIYGLILILTILLMPRGIVGLLARRHRAA